MSQGQGAAAAARVLLPSALDPQLPSFGAQRHALQGLTMGTHWQVQWLGPPSPSHRRAIGLNIQRVLDDVVDTMSPWVADSALSRFNHAVPGSRQALPIEVCTVLACALDVSRRSAGAFDPCVGDLVDRWGFGPGLRHDDAGFSPPEPAQIDALRATGPQAHWRQLDFDGQSATRPAGGRLDLCGIAKGHAVDRIATSLQAAGVASALVDVGGELSGWGLKADGQPWWVALETPDAGATVDSHTRVALHGLCVATSGDHQRCFVDKAGHRQSHTIDPRSGRPIGHGLASVSVLHSLCMWADAWATALMVLGLEAGQRLASQQDLAVLWWQREADGRLSEHCSPALLALAE